MTDLTDDQVRALLDEVAANPPRVCIGWCGKAKDECACYKAGVAVGALNDAAPDLARALLQARADAAAAVALAWENGVAQARLAVSSHMDWNPSTVRDDLLLNIDHGCSYAPDAGTAELAKWKQLAIAGELIALEMRAVEAERDTIAASLAAQTALVATLTGALGGLLAAYAEPDSQICCSGHQCGCRGSTVRDLAEHYAQEALESAEIATMTPEQRADYHLAVDMRPVAKGIAEGQTGKRYNYDSEGNATGVTE